ncbi:MAG TPA: hypothetical protein VKX16_17355 [Chloroflexota bacterium]|nr:hypothetical protein [Chloroflexota bacterium]
MRIFRIQKTYMVPAADKAAAETMVKAAGSGELYLVWHGVRELPELRGGNAKASGWIAELRRQLAI